MDRRAAAVAGSAAAADLLAVLVFVALGRSAHHHGDTAAGLASTWWPFAVGLALGWGVARAWRRPLALAPAGVGAWLGCVAGGMVLRVLSGQGSAVAFVGVALCFLGLFLLGWRLALIALRRPRQAGAARRKGEASAEALREAGATRSAGMAQP